MDNSTSQGDLGESLKDQSISMMSKNQRDTVAKLETRAKEKCMLAGSLVARQVSLIATLAEEESKVQALKLLKAGVISQGAELGSAEAAEGAGQQQGAAPSCPGRDVQTQTIDVAEVVREEVALLRKQKQGLLEAARGAPKPSVHTLQLLEKRNAVLLAREGRSLERIRAERRAKEARVQELEQRLAGLRGASRSTSAASVDGKV